jgi:DNA-binding LacI/PurR family transcriptional regulator
LREATSDPKPGKAKRAETPRRPTMKDVAQHAGVSVSTVSYVLNNSGPVATSRRARVLDAVRVLNYIPNESARSLKRRSASTIGLVVPDLTNQFFALVTEGVERAAAERDVLVVLCAPEATGRPEDHHAKLLQSQRLDGVVYLSGIGTSPTSVLGLANSGPVVLVDEQIPGSELPAIVSNSRRGAREVAAYILDQGHRRLAVIGGPPVLWTAQQRLAGYREALAAGGLDPDEIPVLAGDYRQATGADLAEQALAGAARTRPTALICANDLMALGAIQYCRAAGIRVPEDVSIVGFDDIPIAGLVTPALTTVSQPAREMGYAAARLLLDLLTPDGDDVPTEPFPATVQIRDSVLPPTA